MVSDKFASDKVDFVSLLHAQEYNAIPAESNNILNAVGVSADYSTNIQIVTSIEDMIMKGCLFVDSGSANTYVLSLPSPMPQPRNYFQGMIARFKAGNSCTGASSINISGRGVKSLKVYIQGSSRNTIAGDIVAGVYYEVTYLDGVAYIKPWNSYGANETYTKAEIDAKFVAANPFRVGQYIDYASYLLQFGGDSGLSWRVCDGAELDRASYSTLFAVINTIFGPGNGTTTFNIPDCRNRVNVATNDGSNGMPYRPVGLKYGEETHTLIENELPFINLANGIYNRLGVVDGLGQGAQPDTINTAPNEPSPLNTGIIRTFGSGLPHNNLQPSIVAGSRYIYTGK